MFGFTAVSAMLGVVALGGVLTTCAVQQQQVGAAKAERRLQEAWAHERHKVVRKHAEEASRRLVKERSLRAAAETRAESLRREAELARNEKAETVEQCPDACYLRPSS